MNAKEKQIMRKFWHSEEGGKNAQKNIETSYTHYSFERKEEEVLGTPPPTKEG